MTTGSCRACSSTCPRASACSGTWASPSAPRSGRSTAWRRRPTPTASPTPACAASPSARRQRRSSTRRGRTSTVTASPRARLAAHRLRTRHPPPPTPRPPRRCERHEGIQAPSQAAGLGLRASRNPSVFWLVLQRQIQRQVCGHGTGRGAQRSTRFFSSCRECRWVAAPQHLAHITRTMALAHSGTMIDVMHAVHPMTLSVGHWFVEGVFGLASWGLQASLRGHSQISADSVWEMRQVLKLASLAHRCRLCILHSGRQLRLVCTGSCIVQLAYLN